MFANYPLAIQILGWSVFMGLNGYIGATCPGLNLAVLAFMGMFANRKMGILLLTIAVVLTLMESLWFMLLAYSVGMAATPRKIPSFLVQGTGALNLIIAAIVFFVLVKKFAPFFPSPKWLTFSAMSFLYVLGVWAAITYWFPVISHTALLATVGLLVALCYTGSTSFAIAISTFVFLLVATVGASKLVVWGHEQINAKQKTKAAAQMLQAAANNQQERIAQLWNITDRATKTETLEKALNARNTDLVNFLVKQGMDTDRAMDKAIYEQDLDKINTLIEAGVLVTPSMAKKAAQYNFFAALPLFIEKGVDINEKGSRPLTQASQEGYQEIVEYLLKTGKNSQDTLNEALAAACSRGKADETKITVATLLLTHGAQANNRAGYAGATPLHFASGSGPLELVKLLLIHGADVNVQDDNGVTPLLQAVEADQLEIAKFLLQHGANQTINATYHDVNASPTGYTALFRTQSAGMATLLLENGADPTRVDSNQTPVLIYAVRNRNPELVKVILDSKVDVNARDNEGESALLEALRDVAYAPAQIETVKLLLENGANVHLANNEGQTPLLVAKQLLEGTNQQNEIIQLLKTAGAKQ